MKTLTLARKAKEAARTFRRHSAEDRQQALMQMGKILERNQAEILRENERDMQEGRGRGLNQALLDRLLLTPERLQGIVRGIREVAAQEEVLGVLPQPYVRADGLKVFRERIPLGVVAMIFEGRPNVVVDCSALAIKSGNAILLKGGSEAKWSNAILAHLIREGIKDHIPQDVVQLLDSDDRKGVQELLTLKDYVDVLIPRGGEGLIQYVTENATMPVIAHFKGLCHIYVHHDADLKSAQEICLNAKASRPGVCNAMETLLVHEDVARPFLSNLLPAFEKLNVEVRGCSRTRALFPHIHPATEEDWRTEYLDKILSIKTVKNEGEAMAHIQEFGTHHTEGICAMNPQVISLFKKTVDASCIVVNASTRFNDGGELGLGAELGISTSKLHAYGPMGAREMTTTRFVVEGKGHIRK